MEHELVSRHTIYSCVVGSRAYGLAGPESDVDRRGVFLAPTHLFWSLDKPPSHVEGPDPERFSWELERFCVLALVGNPTVLECLWSPIVEAETEVGRELVALRDAFLSRRVAQSYGGYARDQFTKLEAVRGRTGSIQGKQAAKRAMHMVRLLMAGAHVLGTRQILVDVGEVRDQLLAIKRGQTAWEEIQAWASRLESELLRAAQRTSLPEEPDRARVNDFLVRTRRAHLGVS